ncbi:MAG: zinc ABC transporter substrate-binding protein [archaeon]|nr:MAG: zinc ABC transporter substrate-binding protein [archaeon]
MNNRAVAQVAVVALLILGSGLAGYAAGSSVGRAPQSNGGEGGLKVLATFLPLYDDAKDVLGVKGEVDLLVPLAVDVHEFEPTPSAVSAVQNADVLVFNGAGLEPWLPALVAAAGNPKLILVNSSEGIPLIRVPSEFQEGNRTVDPHVWNDPVLAQIQVRNILEGLTRADQADRQYFTSNADSLIGKFQYLDREIRTGTSDVATRTFVSFHLAFAYLAREYGLNQVAIAGPFEGEPTPTEISNAVAAINQNHLCVAFAESLENPAPMEAVASQTRAHVWILDPIEGLSGSDSNAGATYLAKFQLDIYSLLQALNQADC